MGEVGACPSRQPRTAVLIPAYGGAQTIVVLSGGVRNRVPEILVVDDGSGNDTARVAEGAEGRVLRHSTNGGKGAAIRTGLRYLAERGYERAVALDTEVLIAACRARVPVLEVVTGAQYPPPVERESLCLAVEDTFWIIWVVAEGLWCHRAALS